MGRRSRLVVVNVKSAWTVASPSSDLDRYSLSPEWLSLWERCRDGADQSTWCVNDRVDVCTLILEVGGLKAQLGAAECRNVA